MVEIERKRVDEAGRHDASMHKWSLDQVLEE